MLLYEMVIAIGIVVVLVVAIGGLAAPVMMSPEKKALLRAGEAASIRRCLKLQYEDALAAPLPPRLAILITQLETQEGDRLTA